MSQPAALHAADHLALVIDEMRQCIATRRDRGWLTRALSARIFFELAKILDILSDLLARFRAGTLPLARRTGDTSAIPGPCGMAERRTAAPPPSPAVARNRCSGGDMAWNASGGARADALGDVPAASIAESAALAPCRPTLPLSAPRLPIRRPEDGPRGIEWYPSHVPRPPDAPGPLAGVVGTVEGCAFAQTFCYDMDTFRGTQNLRG